MYGYNFSLIAQAQILNPVAEGDTTITLYPGQGASFTQPPCIAAIALNRSLTELRDAEHVRITGRSGDIITVDRAILGSAEAYTQGTQVLGMWSPEHITHIYGGLDMIEGFLNRTMARRNPYAIMIHTGEQFGLSIVSGMEVQIEKGSLFSNYLLLNCDSTTNLTFVAPTVSTRKDIIQANPDKRILEIKQGVEGGGVPDPDTNCSSLWEATITVGMTDIMLGDFIDRRAF